MNVENINKIIEIIKLEDRAFSMADYGNPSCGTPACICGWANYLANPEAANMNKVDFGDHERAASFLGIDFDDLEIDATDNLFYGEDEFGRVTKLSDITRQEAITTLEKFIETGEVDWSHCSAYEPYNS